MKKFTIALLVIFLTMSVAFQAAADGPVDKLGRGLTNVATCPFEITKGMDDEKQESGIFAGLITGTLKGTVNMVKRAAVGVYEVATFPIPAPKGYKPILKEPEYFLEEPKSFLDNQKDY